MKIRGRQIQMYPMHKWVKTLIKVSLVYLLVISHPAITQSELPELGDPSTKHLNPIQEKLIGQGFYRKLVKSTNFVNDYELQDYIQSLGNRIGQNADLRGVESVFSMVQDNNLNAFAVPGGYITLNSGLLMTTETESELASVIGHELAHLTQRHLPRLIARASDQKLPAMAAILASILIGGDAGIAGFTATNAALASNQLTYSREFEREADAIGIRLLALANFDPKAMAQFLTKMEHFTLHESRQIPAFLKTHPLSHSRVSESLNRAAEYPVNEQPSSFLYYLAKARIRALLVERQDDPILFFTDQSHSTNARERDAAEYGAAVALLQRKEPESATAKIERLSEKYPYHPWIQALHGNIDIALKNYDAAIERYLMLREKHPEQLFISYYLAEAYLANDQPGLAHKSLRYQVRRHPQNLELYLLLTKTNVAMENNVEADQSKAEYLALLGNYAGAVSTLKRAFKGTEEDRYLEQSINARIIEFEKKLRLLHTH